MVAFVVLALVFSLPLWTWAVALLVVVALTLWGWWLTGRNARSWGTPSARRTSTSPTA